MNSCGNRRFGVIQLKKPEYETFVVAYLSLSYVLHIFNLTIRQFIGNTYKLDTLLIYAFLLLILVSVFNEVIRRIKAWQILGIVGVMTVLSVLMLTSEDSSTFTSVLTNIITECVPMFFCGALVYDCAKVTKGLTKVMTIVPYCYLLMMLLFGLNTLTGDTTYSQSDSYSMLLVTLVLISSLFDKITVKQLISAIIGLFFLVAYGARGPIVCCVMFIVLKILTKLGQGSLTKKIGLIVGLCVIGTVIYNTYYKILLWLKMVFSQLGLSVRVVERILNTSFLEDKGRNTIADICIERIKTNPLIGTGPVNDRIYIANHIGGGAEAVGNYPHNIALEFLMQYGVVVGGILLLLLIWLLIKSYRSAPDIQSKDFILILIGTYFFPLFFSGSYLDYRGFYLLVAVCITMVINHKRISANIQGVQCSGNG